MSRDDESRTQGFHCPQSLLTLVFSGMVTRQILALKIGSSTLSRPTYRGIVLMVKHWSPKPDLGVRFLLSLP